MVTNNRLLAEVAAIVATLQETNGAPESTLYMFLNMDMNRWSIVRSVLIEAKLISICAHYVTLTDEGQKVATKLNLVQS